MRQSGLSNRRWHVQSKTPGTTNQQTLNWSAMLLGWLMLTCLITLVISRPVIADRVQIPDEIRSFPIVDWPTANNVTETERPLVRRRAMSG
ncbi:unnamed protein product [Calicophoron daubneyi]|uniref:Uncharacterized protein n=1 Tax=Calicophoron daubneyi TaxID=300641 RepID=A0AAV2TP99_CALDB